MSENKNFEDAYLIKKLQAGDRSVIALLVKKWHKLFCEKAYWIVKDRDAAKDIAQECWIIIIDKIKSLENSKRFKFWAYRIVINKSTDYLRLESKKKKIDLSLNTNIEVDDGSENEKLKKKLFQAIKNLPERQQEVLQFFYLQEYNLKQISDLLNISVGTVKSRLFHAREKLKIILKTIENEN